MRNLLCLFIVMPFWILHASPSVVVERLIKFSLGRSTVTCCCSMIGIGML